MINLKYSLLSATIIAGLTATPALAQSTFNYSILSPGLPATTQTVNGSTVNYDGDLALHGAGATSIQNVLVRAQNCIGTPNKLGNGQPGQSGGSATTGSLAAKTAGVYNGTPAMTCNNTSANIAAGAATSTYEIQPQGSDASGNYGFQAKYVGTGSGFGRKAWYWFGDVFDGGSNANAVAHVYNPFNLVAGDNRWSHIQFAFSDAPIGYKELQTYNTTGNAVTYAGPAIQFPLFVLPVAVAYDQQYGINKSGHGLVFNTQFSAAYNNGSTISSLRLNAKAYCGIFNGTITNWNDPQFKALNKNVALFDPTNDTAARWAADGAPIRLVGRMDNSGTTDVFTRHLAAVCNSSIGYTGTNNYLNHAESLPYNAAANGNVDFTVIRSDVNYKPSSPASKFAGTTNMITGDYYTGSAIANLGNGTSSAAPIGYNGSGLYIVANGGGNVGKAIVAAPDIVEPDGTTLNGKIGYISADFVQPSVDSASGLVAALLSTVGTQTTFKAPTIANALAAVGTTILPPESNSTGAYTPGTDTRQVTQPDGTQGNATRTNPIAWTDVLYSTSGTTLAAPAAGYPITGTTQFFGYTCYATDGNRQAIAELIGSLAGKITKDSTNTAIAKGFLNAPAAAAPGILDQSNIGILPVAWQMAIANTFLSSTSDVSKALATPLYIQSGLVNKVATVKGVTTVTRPTANTAACGSLPGA